MAKKRFGQHFLSDRNILQRIVDFAGVGEHDTVVEIGPGRGALTLVLAEKVHQVIAVEVDPDLASALAAILPAKVDLIRDDALRIDLGNVVKTPYHIVANLPYNIATLLIGRFVQARHTISSVTVLVQREVAERILSGPGSKAYGPLSVGVQYYATVRSGFVIPPGAFTPKPKVESRLIHLRWRPNVADAPGFTRFVQRAFSSRRKKLANNLAEMFPAIQRDEIEAVLRELHVGPDARAENLEVDQFHALYRQLLGR